MSENLLRVNDIKQHFPIRRSIHEIITRKPVQTVKAVDGVSFDIRLGETLGIVGESGCGKSTLARTIMRLYEPTSGSVYFEDEDFTKKDNRQLRDARTGMQMIFQDPYSSLNPRMNVIDIITEPLEYHNIVPKNEVKNRAKELLEMVGISSYSHERFPGEFSGGQRQRIGIARAISVNPKIVFADEPVSSLDVSIQAQIINLLNDLKAKLNLTMAFISHDLTVVRFITDRVAVMYLGKFVEIANTEVLFNHSAHPYTKILLGSAPSLDPRKKRVKNEIVGETPSPIHLPMGCRFHPRCPYKQDKCVNEEPGMNSIGNNHMVACHFPLQE